MADVSRETAPPDPEVVSRLFGARADLAYRYAELLSGPAVVRGLIGPREAPRIWERHLLNCAVIEAAIAPGATLVDIGSGAGLPGIVLALARPDLRITLLEPMQRRVDFLRLVAAELGLEIEIVRGRAEQWTPPALFDVATARAVASLEVLVGWAFPLLGPTGELVAMKGTSATDEVRTAAAALRRLGVSTARIETYGDGMVSPPATVVRIGSTRR